MARRGCEFQKASGTPAVRSANATASLTELSSAEVNRSKRSTAARIYNQSACESCRTCFVTESMSRIYRSCSWRTPATMTCACALSRGANPRRARSDALSEPSACHSDGTRPERFIKDYRIICPITRQNYIGVRSYHEVQGSRPPSHDWTDL